MKARPNSPHEPAAFDSQANRATDAMDRALQDTLNELSSVLCGWCNQRAALQAVRQNLLEMLAQVEDALRDADQALAAMARGPLVNEPDAMAEEPPSEPPTRAVEHMAE